MPILAREPDRYPENLLDDPPGREPAPADDHEAPRWKLVYTRSNREKDLCRKLHRMKVPFLAPVFPQRKRSPSGRVRTAYVPLFSNYVFLFGGAEEQYDAMTTNTISRVNDVPDPAGLLDDLKGIDTLLGSGEKITREQKLEEGDAVRVKTGPFKGLVGTILKRQNERRLLVAVDFLQQGASASLEDYEVEALY
ncbi:transcription termination/antitermination protein NusG [Alienimonas chondri]|uniref:transcription termination/antitermination protein NusG n=1 Tax=Alienimonas chondri TaxID=2681879 RepID=UPI0014889ED4|nr:KOW motif-containing protein [Alienimonas chondri]